MQYWYIRSYHRTTGEPIWARAKAYGYRRKNGKDQVFVPSIDGKKVWIFAPIVETKTNY